MYKILRIIPLQQIDMIVQYYRAKKLNELSYEKALESLRRAALLYPSGFKSHLTKLGWEVFEVIPKFKELQKKWVEENHYKCDFSKRGWIENLFLKQVTSFKPDIIYFERGNSFIIFSDDFRRQLKRNYPFIKAIVGSCGNVGFDPRRYNDLDLMFAINSVFQADFEKHGIRSRIVHHCFDEEILKTLPEESAIMEDFVFLGSSGYGYPGHRERYLDLIWLMEQSPLKSWVFENVDITNRVKIRANTVRFASKFSFVTIQLISNLMKVLFKKPTSTIIRLLEDIMRCKKCIFFDDWYFSLKPLSELFPDRCFKPLFGMDYYSLLKKSKVILNRHVDALNHYGNIRTFEVCGTGGCLLTDRGFEMRNLFDLDREIVSYSSREECLDKVKFLLNNDSIRAEIGRRGNERALKDHTFGSRATVIEGHLKELLSSVSM